MNENSLARRYTRALVQTMKDRREFASVKSQLQSFQHVLDSDPSLRTAFTTFLLAMEKKKAALELIAGEAGLTDKTRRFLGILLAENRLTLLHAVILQMDEQWYETRGIERVTVYSVIPLDSGQSRRLSENLKRLYDREVAVQNEIDPSLVAGIKIRHGSVTYDFSLQGNLQRLKEKIAEEK